MKIGIVTQSLANNYGGILQNYALQMILKRLGHIPVTIDFKCPPVDYRTYSYVLVKALVANIIPSKRRPIPKRDINRRSSTMDAFVNKNLLKTNLLDHYYPELVDEYGLDALIVGSDQVWRPIYNYYLEDMFLQFAVDADIPKIAYAASFGVDNWEFTADQTRSCRRLAHYFKSISVRERSGIDLCRDFLNIDAVEMVDPTMLLSRTDYETLCKDIPVNKKNILAAYVLDLNNEKKRFINKLAEKHNLEVVLFRADLNCSLSIEEWIAMFRDSKYIVTDSFHGTVFSIIFNKPFLSIPNVGRGTTRFTSLLAKFGLEHRLVSTFDTYNETETIDWNQINGIIVSLKYKACSYLTSHLSCI